MSPGLKVLQAVLHLQSVYSPHPSTFQGVKVGWGSLLPLFVQEHQALPLSLLKLCLPRWPGVVAGVPGNRMTGPLSPWETRLSTLHFH